MKHFAFFINCSCLLMLSQQLGLAEKLMVRVVIVLVATFLATGVLFKARFSLACSTVAVTRAMSLSSW